MTVLRYPVADVDSAYGMAGHTMTFGRLVRWVRHDCPPYYCQQYAVPRMTAGDLFYDRTQRELELIDHAAYSPGVMVKEDLGLL